MLIYNLRHFNGSYLPYWHNTLSSILFVVADCIGSPDYNRQFQWGTLAGVRLLSALCLLVSVGALNTQPSPQVKEHRKKKMSSSLPRGTWKRTGRNSILQEYGITMLASKANWPQSFMIKFKKSRSETKIKPKPEDSQDHIYAAPNPTNPCFNSIIPFTPVFLYCLNKIWWPWWLLTG